MTTCLRVQVSDLKAIRSAKEAPPRIRESYATVLRATVLGEYASMLLIVYAGFGLIAWGVGTIYTLVALSMVVVGIWSIVRSAGAFAGTWISTSATTACGCSIVILDQCNVSAVPRWINDGPFSSANFLLVCGAILTLDLIDSRWNKAADSL